MGAGHAEPDHEQLGDRDARLVGRAAYQVGGDVERRVAVRVGVGLGLDLGQDRRAPVGHGDPHVPVTDVDAGHAAGPDRQRHQQRRPPAPALVRRAAVLGLDDEAGREQLGDQARDRGPRQSGPAGEVGAALRAARAEQGRDRAEVRAAQLGQGVSGHRGSLDRFVPEAD